MWRNLTQLLSRFSPSPTPSIPPPAPPPIPSLDPLGAPTAARERPSAMVTTRSQERASLEPIATSPAQESPDGSGRRDVQRALAQTVKGGKRRRLSPPEPAAAPDGQGSDDSKRSQTLAPRPHESFDAASGAGEDADALGAVALDLPEEEGLHAAEIAELAEREGAMAGESDGAHEETEVALPELQSSQSPDAGRYERDQQVIESTQDLDFHNITASENDTQMTALRESPATPSHGILEDTPDMTLQESVEVEADEDRDQAVAGSEAGTEPRTRTTRAKHVRFNSEDPTASLPAELPKTNGHQNEAASEESDDNAAPETVTAAASKGEARSQANEVGRAEKRAMQSEKARRRERDARLKEQAKARKKPSKKAVKESSEALDPSLMEAEDLARAMLDSGQLPDVLPEAIFKAHAALANRPASATVQPQARTSKKRKFDDVVGEKRPKDVVREQTRVRVLREEATTLPPRVSRRSKHVREEWLAGYRGDERVVAQRRRVRHPLLAL